MKRMLIVLIFFLFLFIIPQSAEAQPRLADCNVCGWCIDDSSLSADQIECMKCRYPYVPLENPAASLQIITDINDPNYNRPMAPANGRYYTQLGCLDTGIGSFTNPSASGGVLNFILTRAIFPTIGVLAMLTLIYGAYIIIMGRDNPMQINRGKMIIISAIVGVIFSFGAILITTLIGADILRIPGFNRGSEIEIVIASTCVDEANTAQNQDPCPKPSVDITDLAGNVLDSENLTQIKGPVGSWPPGEYHTISFLSSVKAVNPNEYFVRINYTDDHAPPGTGMDKNLGLQSIKLDGYTCTKYLYSNGNGTTEVTPIIGMYWAGSVTCTKWAQSASQGVNQQNNTKPPQQNSENQR